MSKKLSKNGEKLKNLRKEPSESKKEKIKQRREDKKNSESIPKPVIQPKDNRPDADLMAPDEDLEKYQKRMKLINHDYQMELNPAKSQFGRLPPSEVIKINTMINGGLLFNFFVIECGSRQYITLGDVISLPILLENTKMFIKGSNRLLMRNIWENGKKICHDLTRFMLVSKFWYARIDFIKKQLESTIYLNIKSLPICNRLSWKCYCTKCQNTIANSDVYVNHLMNLLRNDETYYAECAECAGMKIYRNETVPADNYAACSRCRSIFYIAFNYNGSAAKCPGCRW